MTSELTPWQSAACAEDGQSSPNWSFASHRGKMITSVTRKVEKEKITRRIALRGA
jgi:hypothetical protein